MLSTGVSKKLSTAAVPLLHTPQRKGFLFLEAASLLLCTNIQKNAFCNFPTDLHTNNMSPIPPTSNQPSSVLLVRENGHENAAVSKHLLITLETLTAKDVEDVTYDDLLFESPENSEHADWNPEETLCHFSALYGVGNCDIENPGLRKQVSTMEVPDRNNAPTGSVQTISTKRAPRNSCVNREGVPWPGSPIKQLTESVHPLGSTYCAAILEQPCAQPTPFENGDDIPKQHHPSAEEFQTSGLPSPTRSAFSKCSTNRRPPPPPSLRHPSKFRDHLVAQTADNQAVLLTHTQGCLPGSQPEDSGAAHPPRKGTSKNVPLTRVIIIKKNDTATDQVHVIYIRVQVPTSSGLASQKRFVEYQLSAVRGLQSARYM